MNTTALFIEILIAGTLASCWVVLAILTANPDMVAQAGPVLRNLGDFNALVTATVIMIVYLLGWMSHFLGEVLLDPLFQSRFRDDLYSRRKLPFYSVRSVVFEKASPASIDDIQFDRQVIRITRAATLNLVLISVVAFTYPGISLARKTTFAVLAMLMAVLSFLYWRRRYKSTFHKFLNIYDVIVGGSEPGLAPEPPPRQGQPDPVGEPAAVRATDDAPR